MATFYFLRVATATPFILSRVYPRPLARFRPRGVFRRFRTVRRFRPEASARAVAASDSFGQWPTAATATAENCFWQDRLNDIFSVSNVFELSRIPVPLLVYFECVLPFPYFFPVFSTPFSRLSFAFEKQPTRISQFPDFRTRSTPLLYLVFLSERREVWAKLRNSFRLTLFLPLPQ